MVVKHKVGYQAQAGNALRERSLRGSVRSAECGGANGCADPRRSLLDMIQPQGGNIPHEESLGITVRTNWDGRGANGLGMLLGERGG